ncbi:MAG: carboxypeptidase regulatory-like domain-containing protein [Nitrospiraceae bacterium]|nr:carboxypeptidase regulatory-like domain-containing protein [Nitrospiraceae bacterium]
MKGFRFIGWALAAAAVTALAACGGGGNGSTGSSTGVSAVGAKATNTVTGTVTGKVVDINTGSPVSGVTISDGGAGTAKTDSTGSYSLKEATGNYTLKATASGYLGTWQVASVTSGSTTTTNWSLTKSYGTQAIPAAKMSYVVFAWNDLGMHCDQDDYSYCMILPPYNTLHAQVIQRGGEGASVVTSGITVSYTFPKKTNTALHTNFWQYAAQYGFNNLPVNTGISGTKLSGNMSVDSKNLGFVATGIPLSPYDDDGTWDPYGAAVLTVKNSSGQVLQTANVVAPVSTELLCSNCHGSTNPFLNILQDHDKLNGTTLASQQANGIVHACAECHADNALGMMGKTGVENLSLAIHNFHKDKMTSAYAQPGVTLQTTDCYNCHPGPKTQCLRGQMYRAGKSCHDCHGDMNTMASGILAGRQPWLQEPQCGSCHGAGHAENANTLYRNSVLNNAIDGDMNGKIYCEACHNSTHAEFTSSNPADPTIPNKFQGDGYWIWSCQICHSSESGSSIHSGGGTSSTDSGTSTSSTSTDSTSTTSTGSTDSTSTNYYISGDN